MKQKGRSVRKYSIDELNTLVLSIIQGTDDTEESLSLRIGRNKGYIAQTKSRGIVSERLWYALQEELKNKTAKSKVEVTVDELTTLRAGFKALSNFVAMQASSTQGRPVEAILDELEQTTRVLLRDMLKG